MPALSHENIRHMIYILAWEWGRLGNSFPNRKSFEVAKRQSKLQMVPSASSSIFRASGVHCSVTALLLTGCTHSHGVRGLWQRFQERT
jgi:hypothetical protein